MKWMIIILCVLLALILIILLTKLTIRLSFYHGNDNDELTIKFKAWGGLFRYKIEVPLIQIDEESASVILEEKVKKPKAGKEETTKDEKKKITPKEFLNSLSDAKELLIHVYGLHRIIRSFLKKVTVKDLLWNTKMGTGDAASTGMVTGGIWTVKSSIVSWISRSMRLQDMPLIHVEPCFQQKMVITEFRCMIQFRIGNAILAGAKLLKYWRGGKAKFKTKPLSMVSSENHST
ncbi:hypothetical protein Q73_11030 [Bacillus coahuilensis m2-6]|uniref:DUF2953 domain-containing protein n=1 Tax=Bacillus coahuilensis TaxID=408580 RepID=UPI00075029DF|nr:DUF2953 domain-containing protein [Bacillus coahuilensis]KUP06679.1 hypothetical protein Q73_11030 [Bacillus coahuilensis m2-6]